MIDVVVGGLIAAVRSRSSILQTCAADMRAKISCLRLRFRIASPSHDGASKLVIIVAGMVGSRYM